MRSRTTAMLCLTLGFLLIAAPAWACGGLVAPNGSVSLVRTTTLAAYHQGVEHYVTSFEFAGGGGGEFGSIVPLPGVPTNVIRGGDWTLQRLVQETQPQPLFDAAAATPAAESARVILKTEIDALDVVVLEGGGTSVGNWAREHGFLLPPDAPEVLDFYASRSPIFMTIRYDAERAREQGLATGDGTPVHVVIPTTNPWVPLRILALGAPAQAPVEADVYLLTDREPALLPEPVSPNSRGIKAPGLILQRSEAASESLITDLRSDKGMKWIPSSGMWLTYLEVDSTAGGLSYDLAVDASGAGHPSPVAAGMSQGGAFEFGDGGPRWAPTMWTALALLGGLAIVAAVQRRRITRPAA
jgi:uncharacterized protein DUF2330